MSNHKNTSLIKKYEKGTEDEFMEYVCRKFWDRTCGSSESALLLDILSYLIDEVKKFCTRYPYFLQNESDLKCFIFWRLAEYIQNNQKIFFTKDQSYFPLHTEYRPKPIENEKVFWDIVIMRKGLNLNMDEQYFPVWIAFELKCEFNKDTKEIRNIFDDAINRMLSRKKIVMQYLQKHESLNPNYYLPKLYVVFFVNRRQGTPLDNKSRDEIIEYMTETVNKLGRVYCVYMEISYRDIFSKIVDSHIS